MYHYIPNRLLLGYFSAHIYGARDAITETHNRVISRGATWRYRIKRRNRFHQEAAKMYSPIRDITTSA